MGMFFCMALFDFTVGKFKKAALDSELEDFSLAKSGDGLKAVMLLFVKVRRITSIDEPLLGCVGVHKADFCAYIIYPSSCTSTLVDLSIVLK